MLTADFDFFLPPELIAQSPLSARDESRLLVIQRKDVRCTHRGFRDLLEYLVPGDVMVFNNSRVLHARLRGANTKTDGRFEILLLIENRTNDWWVMLRPGKRARVGTQIAIQTAGGQTTDVRATITEIHENGNRRLTFTGTPDIRNSLDQLGEVPLPPYISRVDARERAVDQVRYQTVYAKTDGSVAAPTAGLHFTQKLLDQIRSKGVQLLFLTLHVGPGTFAPVKSAILTAHIMHEEQYEIRHETANVINEAKRSGRRVIAVGTTTTRVLESVATMHEGRLVPGPGRTKIFIHPPYPFRIVDGLLTNFHLPRSTLLMLASAFVSPNQTSGRELILSAYAEAIRERYRFFSYGDAMLIL